VQQAARGWRALGGLLSEMPTEPERTTLPTPAARLSAEGITITPPGRPQASIRLLSFDLQPGQAMGVIGQSGAGKTSLARAVTGLWRPANGRIRLDGAAIDQYDPAALGQYIGYLPQRVQLFDGTIAENIARLSPTPDDDAVVEAAGKAAAHEMILQLPDGYETRVSATEELLSGGQIQRIGLARAIYGEPVLLVLDEPNSALDTDGTAALNRAIRTMKEDGRSVIIMTHRPSAIHECDVLLVMEDGARKAFGPRDEVLRNVIRNHRQIRQVLDGGGGEDA